MSNYFGASGYEGVGANIKWCGRSTGGKRCGFCKHHAIFSEWSEKWNWFYLLKWREHNWYHYEEQAHFRWGKRHRINIEPGKYRNTGLKEFELKSLLNKGCKKNKKCSCMNVAQRAFWFCPSCYLDIKTIAKMHNKHIHDIMLTDRNETKTELLILKLSGTI